MTDMRLVAEPIDIQEARRGQILAQIVLAMQKGADARELHDLTRQLVSVSNSKPKGWEWVTAAGLDEELPPIPWVVEGLELAAGPPTMFAGYGYSGKTLAAQSLALSVAAGLPVFGMFRVNLDGKVRHIDYEQGRRLTMERYQRLGRAAGVRFADLGDRLGFVALPPEKLDSEGIEELLVRELEGVTLAVIDSYRAGAPAIDENSSEARVPLDMLARVSELTGCCIVVIHHARKANDNDSDSRQILRGSSALFDACQAVWTFSAKKRQPTTVECAKARLTGKNHEPFVLHTEDVAHGENERWGLQLRFEDEADAVVEARDRRRRQVEDMVLAVFREVGPCSPRRIRTELRGRGISLRNGDEAVFLEALEASGKVRQVGTSKGGSKWDVA